MATFTFSDSQYRFIEPIRYFKANDPYYFEVDNIPIKQLQENCLWLRDQLKKVTGERSQNESLEIKRKDIDELRPYATGSDRIVRVKPGRFTARINDVGKSPLALYNQILGTELEDTELYKLYGANDSTDPLNDSVLAALTRFKSSLASNAQNMNGLSERAFTWAVKDTTVPSDFASTTTDLLKYLSIDGSELLSPIGPFLYSQAILPWAMAIATGNLAGVSYYSLVANYRETTGFSTLPLLETEFVKRWRGVARTAIVDIPSEITVEVPAFDAQDFYYYDESGNKVYQTEAASRIDLVFIYSKPIDASSTTVFKNGVVTQLTAPALGIVRGAGIGPRFQTTAFRTVDSALDALGNPMIQAHVADANQTTTGFAESTGNEQTQTVRGSFPSPEDILNISPLLVNSLEENAIELVGQSILPVAYVYVKAAPTTIAGTQVISTEDVIDIRPFFRTAELTYNERAGIAAAVPQLSLANPAVGRSELDKELYRMTNFVTSRINQALTGGNNSDGTSIVFANTPRVAATGYIFGGLFFGPEAVLLKFYKDKFASDSDTNNDSINYIKNYIRSRYGYGDPTIVEVPMPVRPDWDVAEWCKLGNYTLKGDRINDRITPVWSNTAAIDPIIKAGSTTNPATVSLNEASLYSWLSTPTQTLRGFNNVEKQTGSFSKVSFYYISKKIRFNRPSWMLDYHVDVELLNSMFLTERGARRDNQDGDDSASYTGMWVEKGFNEFTVYVAFNARDVYNSNGPQSSLLPSTNRDSDQLSSFIVMVRDILASDTTAVTGNNLGHLGNVRVGVCTYPTVKWKLTAIPRDGAGDYHYYNLNSENPVINLQGG